MRHASHAPAEQPNDHVLSVGTCAYVVKRADDVPALRKAMGDDSAIGSIAEARPDFDDDVLSTKTWEPSKYECWSSARRSTGGFPTNSLGKPSRRSILRICWGAVH